MSVWKKVASAAGGGDVGAWDLSYAYYDPPASLAGNLSTATFSGSFSVASQEANPYGVFFKPDGTKMYITGDSGNDVNEYNLSTPWVVSTASYLQNFSVFAQEASPSGLSFKSDGTKMYVIGFGSDNVNEYDLSTPWDISTASYLQNFSVAAQDLAPVGLFFKSDGTKMYVMGAEKDDVNEYDLSTPWDVSTASYLQNFSVAAQETFPEDIAFTEDGIKMYIIGRIGDAVYEYDLSTPWDISTASYVQSFSIGELNSRGLFVRPDGGGFYIVGTDNDTVYQYTLGGFSVADQETSPTGLFFKTDGTKMYICGSSGQEVNEYDLSTAWDISSASYLRNKSVSAQETSPTGLFFKPDGTKMYIVGSVGDDVNEYSLSSAWNISTASYVRNKSVAAQDTVPTGLFFKPDGTKMYVVGLIGDAVYEYDLSSAWNISTASYLQNFSVASQETNPTGLFFKDDGTKMYIVGSTGDDVNEYDLSSAWNISTASYLQNFSVAAQQTFPSELFFKDDGTQMFIVGTTPQRVFSYTLGPQP